MFLGRYIGLLYTQRILPPYVMLLLKTKWRQEQELREQRWLWSENEEFIMEEMCPRFDIDLAPCIIHSIFNWNYLFFMLYQLSPCSFLWFLWSLRRLAVGGFRCLLASTTHDSPTVASIKGICYYLYISIIFHSFEKSQHTSEYWNHVHPSIPFISRWSMNIACGLVLHSE